jgi:hypothetical protein
LHCLWSHPAEVQMFISIKYKLCINTC